MATASRGSERLSRLVDDIIDLEVLQSGRFGFAPALHDVADLATAASRSLQPLGQKQGVQIVVVGAAGQAWCDADRVEQVLVNLIGNALKFSSRRTTITVSTQPRGDELVVSVRDQGRGIPADELDAIFDRFHQVEVDDSREKGGAGLGLTICQHIVHLHGGRIWVESPGGEAGTTFSFTLPAGPPAPGGDVASPRAARAASVSC